MSANKIKYMGADENGLVFKRLIPTAGISETDPELAQRQLAFLKEGIETDPVMAPMLVSMLTPDGEPCAFGEYEERRCVARAALIIADYRDQVKAIYLPWVRQVRAIMEEFAADDRVELLVAGEPYFLAWMLLDLLEHWWLFVLSLLIAVAVLWYEFRNWRGALFPLLGVGATILMTLGLMGLTQFKLTTMMVLTPMFLLAIGIGHSVQVTRRFMQEQTGDGDCRRAAQVAIGRTMVPATLSIVTDMVGFATLATVDISFYRAYAWFGLFGMFTLLFTTTSLIPLLMLSWPCKGAGTAVEHPWEHRLGERLASLLAGLGKWLPIGLVAVILILSGHYTRITEAIWDDPVPGVEKGIDYSRAAFKRESDTIDQLLALNRIMPGVISVTIPIRGRASTAPECIDVCFPGSILFIEDKAEKARVCAAWKEKLGYWDSEVCGAQGVFNQATVLADIKAMENWMRAHPAIGFTGSYAQYVRLVNMLLAAEPGERPKRSDLRIPTSDYLRSIDPDDDRDPDEVVQLYNGLLETMTEEGDMDAFVARDWNWGVIMGFINTMLPRETHAVTMDIQD